MAASDHLGPQFYHGTAAQLVPGQDAIEPGHAPNFTPESDNMVHFTNDPGHAAGYADKAYARNASGRPRVYQVEPTGNYDLHMEVRPGRSIYRSASPLRDVREIEPEAGG